ncbi:PRC-barrel domain-containing protein [uncultured Rhodospira sp.]|uniref:PRC-barrel domain-containing protein n=1 Tax=uncultured Rhodospira sp. TaxID=1936189 RepID=UPI002631111E|nr:PRC-barrel domain-containing protein [uncultured Rhodospira sp.]
MKRLLATTAIVTMAAAPLTAHAGTTGQDMQQTQAETQVSATAQGGSSDMTTNEHRITADRLLEKNVYVAPDGAGGHGDGSSQDMESNSDWEMGFSDVPSDWENVGNIVDLLISRDGKVSAVVVDSGGMLDLQEKRLRLNMEELRFVKDSDDRDNFFVRYTGDRDVLESQGYDEAEAEQAGETSYSLSQTGATEHEDGQQTMANVTGSGETEQTDAERTAERTMAQTNENAEALSETEFNELSAENLEDSYVYGQNGEWVGEVSDVLISDGGDVTHVIVDVGGFLGIGEKPVALGYDQIHIGRDGAHDEDVTVQLDQTEEQLEQMETYRG